MKMAGKQVQYNISQNSVQISAVLFQEGETLFSYNLSVSNAFHSFTMDLSVSSTVGISN